MRKLLIAAVALLAVVVGMFFALRDERHSASKLSVVEEAVSGATIGNAGKLVGQPNTGLNTTVSLSRELLTLASSAPDAVRRQSDWASRARDRYYEQLLSKTPRDQAKEGELLSQLMERFSDKPDASVGEIACNAEFCRAELLGSGQFDLLKRYGKIFTAALDAKGFRFFLTNRDDPANPKVSFYFGRDSSWTVPDFSKIDL